MTRSTTRLVTKVIYLEDPDQAVPFRMAKDQVFVHTLNPSEPPLTVATTLGRPVAIVRLGGRRPSIEEIQAGGVGDLALDWVTSGGMKPCPFLSVLAARAPRPLLGPWLRHDAESGPALAAARDDSICATAAIAEPRPRREATDVSAVSTHATRSSGSTSGSAIAQAESPADECRLRHAPGFAEVRISWAPTKTSTFKPPKPTRCSRSLRKPQLPLSLSGWSRTRPPSWLRIEAGPRG